MSNNLERFCAVKYRDTGEWKLIGPLKWYMTKEDISGPRAKRARYKSTKRQVYSVYPKPEHVSPFVETHRVFEAANKEDAQWQVSTWK